MKFKSLATTTASAIALAGINGAVAQDAGDDRESAVDRVLSTVTVTATKKADVEDVQDVPIAVTAFNSDSLDALNVTDIQSLSFTTPNVSLDQIGTVKGAANFAIRGLGVNSSIVSIDPAVGTFIDGVYMGVNNGVVIELLDLESIEILRGPQGLLFGRNTTGGAVLINTSNPTDEFSYKLRASYDGPFLDDDRGGNNSNLQAIVSGPLIEDVLKGKIAVMTSSDDGYFKNNFTDDDHGALDTTLIRGALEYTPTEKFSLLAKVEHFDSDGDGAASQNRAYSERDSFDLNFNETGFEENEILFASLRADYDVDFGNGTITNIFGYRDYEGASLTDIDGTPTAPGDPLVLLFHANAIFEQEQISNELRYAGTFGNADVTTGVYYFDQEYAGDEVRNIFVAAANSIVGFYGGGQQDHTVYGLFGQVDYNFNDKLTGIFGLRYSSEEKDAAVSYVIPSAPCSVVAGTCPTTGNDGFEDSNDWTNWTPKIGFQYFPNDNTQYYGNYTKAFRSGGYNFRITDVAIFNNIVAQTGSPGFDEEEVDNFELGFKYDTEDGRGQLNAAVFHTIIEDMQREVNESGAAGVVQNIINTADATLTGLELEGRYAITDNLLITANLGLIDASYDEVFFDLSADGMIDGADLDLALPRTPETTYGIGFLHDLDLGDLGSLVSRVNFQHRDEVAYTDSNFGWIQEADYLDANFTWNTAVDGLSFSIYGKNLLDEVQAGGDTQTPFAGPLSNGVNAPFDDRPGGGTFSPLSKGRLVGIEFTLSR